MIRGLWEHCSYGTEIGSGMVALRMDRRLHGRIDASDVIQEAYLEASVRLNEYLGDPSMPFFLWLRFLTGQKLVTLHRHHLGVQMRDAGQEVALCRGPLPEASSAALAAHLLGHDTRASEAAIRAELKIQVQEALNSMDPLDREVLALAPLRAIEPRRDCPGDGNFGGRRRQEVHPGPGTAQTGPGSAPGGLEGLRP